MITTKHLVLTLVGVGMISACSTSPKSPKHEQDHVISRIDDLSSRPSWLKESEPFRIENGHVISLASTTITGDQRIDSAYRIAENSAKAGIATAIEQKLEFIFQNAEEGTEIGANQARFIGAEASKLMTSSIRPHKRYWEKVHTALDNGERVTRVRVFSSVSMPESEFRKAMINAARKNQGKKGLSKDFADKVNKHWDRFTASAPETANE